MTTTIALISRAKRMLETVKSFDDILAVANLAARARDLANAAGASRETVNAATRIMLDARRLAGQTLTEMKAAGQLDAGKGGNRKSRSQPGTVKLPDLGLTKNQSARYQQEASVPQERYEAWVAKTTEIDDGKPDAFLSAAGLRSLSKSSTAEHSQTQCEQASEPPSDLSVGKIVSKIRRFVWDETAGLSKAELRIVADELREIATEIEQCS